jgi:hypothetical protein
MSEKILEQAIDLLIESDKIGDEEFVKRAKEKILSLSKDDRAKIRHVCGALNYHTKLLR